MCASSQMARRGAPTMRLCPSVSAETQRASYRENTMRSTFTKIPATLAIACAVALGVFAATANAQVRDTNKTALRAAGRDKLDAVVSRMSGLESQSVTAVGYADRMGTGASNQILSE